MCVYLCVCLHEQVGTCALWVFAQSIVPVLRAAVIPLLVQLRRVVLLKEQLQ